MSSISERPIVWLDIDNTLYPGPGSGIALLMKERIRAYFVDHGLSSTYEEADALASRYYTEYGLSLRGLIKHHRIDPLDFDLKCDGALPLETILTPDPNLRNLIKDMLKSNTRVWALTNAYINHARRVLKILELDDLIEEIVYCDYSKPDFKCKPEKEFYLDAMQRAGVTDPSKCFFVDDSLPNVRMSRSLGWGSSVYFRELAGDEKIADLASPVEGVDATISSLLELRTVWPQLFAAPEPAV